MTSASTSSRRRSTAPSRWRRSSRRSTARLTRPSASSSYHNADARVPALLRAHPRLDVLLLRSQRGLSRARNAALPQLDADLVAFPDDDCVYAPDLLARLADRFVSDGALDGLTGRAVDADGSADLSWRADAAVLDPSNLWNRVISFTLFLRRDVVAQRGALRRAPGLGSGTPWSSGQELDYVLRAIQLGVPSSTTPT